MTTQVRSSKRISARRLERIGKSDNVDSHDDETITDESECQMTHDRSDDDDDRNDDDDNQNGNAGNGDFKSQRRIKRKIAAPDKDGTNASTSSCRNDVQVKADSTDISTRVNTAKKRKRPNIQINPQTYQTNANNNSNNSNSKRNNNKKNKKKKKGRGPVEARTCPHCQKEFSIDIGLKYHLEHKVCLRINSEEPNSSINSNSNKKSIKSAKKKSNMEGVKPFPILKPGMRCKTIYGIVEVLIDDRAPSDHGNTPIQQNYKEEIYKYKRKAARISNRINTIRIHAAKKNRQRRDRLLKMYLNREMGCYNQTQIWNLYCNLSSVQNILSNMYSRQRDEKIRIPLIVENHPWMELKDNPMEPKDSYPDRIVKCILLGHPKHLTTNNLNHHHPTLYLRRRLLQPYDPELPSYNCPKCNKSFTSHPGYKTHVEDRLCKTIVQNLKQERDRRIQEIDDAILTDIKPLPPPTVPTTLLPGQKRPPKVRKNKIYPAWMQFHFHLSPWYPEIFKPIGFKRGSNNTKFMKKVAEQSGGSARKKKRKSRSKGPVELSILRDIGVKWMDYSKHTIYPQAFDLLKFKTEEDAQIHEEEKNKKKEPIPVPEPEPEPELEPEKIKKQKTNPSKTLKRKSLDDENNSEGVKTQKDKSTSSDEKQNGKEPGPAIKAKKTKKKRPKAPLANPKPISTPMIVDISVLVEEIRAGRYPSMKPYKGEHTDCCILCKEAGTLYCCEFCENAEHLECLMTKVTIRDPEPEDSFMCHRCVQTIVSRRARAEKRRLQKRNSAISKVSGVSDHLMPNDGSNVLVPLDGSIPNSTLPVPGIIPQDVVSLKREVVWNHKDVDQHIMSYKKCPSDGPGGLICCDACTASYSRFLSSTAKEMETQTISNVGHEVSDLMELLQDAQLRLQQVVEVAKTNYIRRSLFSRNEIEPSNSDRNFPDVASIMNLLHQ